MRPGLVYDDHVGDLIAEHVPDYGFHLSKLVEVVGAHECTLVPRQQRGQAGGGVLAALDFFGRGPFRVVSSGVEAMPASTMRYRSDTARVKLSP